MRPPENEGPAPLHPRDPHDDMAVDEDERADGPDDEDTSAAPDEPPAEPPPR